MARVLVVETVEVVVVVVVVVVGFVVVFVIVILALTEVGEELAVVTDAIEVVVVAGLLAIASRVVNMES